MAGWIKCYGATNKVLWNDESSVMEQTLLKITTCNIIRRLHFFVANLDISSTNDSSLEPTDAKQHEVIVPTRVHNGMKLKGFAYTTYAIIFRLGLTPGTCVVSSLHITSSEYIITVLSVSVVSKAILASEDFLWIASKTTFMREIPEGSEPLRRSTASTTVLDYDEQIWWKRLFALF